MEMIENNGRLEDPVLNLPQGRLPPLLPQCMSSRRQGHDRLDTTLESASSDESANHHPFAPLNFTTLPPKFLKPISPRKQGNNQKTSISKELISKDEDPQTADGISQTVTNIEDYQGSENGTKMQHPESPKDLPSIGTNLFRRQPHDSISSGDSGKSTLSEASAEFQTKVDIIPPVKKHVKSKVKFEIKQQVCHDVQLRQHLIKISTSKADDSTSILSYLSSNADYVPLDIVSLKSQKTEEDPFNTMYSETKIDSLGAIFSNNGVSFKRIFIQGSAGCGKTTMMRKLVKDWATGKENATKEEKKTSYLSYIYLMFYVPLDQVADERNIEDVLAKYVLGKDCPVNGKDIVKVIKEQKTNCVFLLDGYDEYSDASIAIDQLITGETFPDATIVLTSQRWKLLTPKIAEIYDRLLEIKGFSDENARTFVSKFIRSKKLGIADVNMTGSELWKRKESVRERAVPTNPLLLLYECICFLQTSTIPAKCSGVIKEIIPCLYDLQSQENTATVMNPKEKALDADQKAKPTLQALLVNVGKIAFRCLLARKKCPKRVPSHWFGEEMYRDYLVLALELGLIIETKIVHKQKRISVAAFACKWIEEYLAAFYLCNVNDSSVVFHEQAAIIELINIGKIEKAFVYKFLDILILASSVNPMIACELLTFLIPEMESDCIVMEKLNRCAEEMEVIDGVKLPQTCLSFDRHISQTLIKLCTDSLEYLTFVNCELETTNMHEKGDFIDSKESINREFFTESLPNLTFLKLDHFTLRNVQIRSTIFPKLQELNLRSISPAESGVFEILTKVTSPVLKEVTIDYCDFSDKTLSFPKLESLSKLTVGSIKLCPRGWKAFFQSLENLSNLNMLIISKVHISGEGIVFPRLKMLTRLDLRRMEFDSDKSCVDFCASLDNLRKLEVFEVSEMSVMQFMSKLGMLIHLKQFSLNNIVFNSEIAFPKSNLSVLELNHITFAEHTGQRFVSSMSHLKNLTTLKLIFCSFEKENINFLMLKSVKKVILVNPRMTSTCWCIGVFSLGQLENLEALELTYTADEETNVGKLIKDMVDKRSPVPKIVPCTKSGKETSVTVDFTTKVSPMKTGSCCIQ